MIATFALLTAGIGIGAPGVAGAASPFRLSASATIGGSRVSVSRTLSTLHSDDLQVVKHDRSSITVGYPAVTRKLVKGKRRTVKAKPCAITTFRLGVVAGDNPASFVATAIPDATRQGLVTELPSNRVSMAWRLFDTIKQSSFLYADGIAATPARKGALSTLTMHGHMTRINDTCGGTNSFTLGPPIIPTLMLYGS
jgi:hypothetical protein